MIPMTPMIKERTLRFLAVAAGTLMLCTALISCSDDNDDDKGNSALTRVSPNFTYSTSADNAPPESPADPSQTTSSFLTDPSTDTSAPITTKVPTVTTAPITTKTEDKPTAPSTTDGKNDSDIVKVTDYIPDIHVDLRYAGENNLSGVAIYDYKDAYLRYGTVKKLAKVQSKLRDQGLSLLIWDAYRPYNMQHKLYMILPECATNPQNGKYVAFNTGGTVAVAVVKADGSALPLPSDFDVDGSKADRDFSDLSAESAKYAKLLDELMTANGFEQYLTTKWYRYTDSVSYPIDYKMTIGEEGITVCEKWTVSCEKTLNLRKYASTSSKILDKIPRGKEITVFFMHEKFAYVEYNGTRGYVLAAYLVQSDENGWKSELSTVKPTDNYSYSQMNSDLLALAKEFPDLLKISSIGKSELGKDLTLAILGNEKAEKKIFVSAAIHAREHMIALYSTAQIEYMLRNPSMICDGTNYTFAELLDKVCFYIVPMSNPDGIEIVQTLTFPDAFKSKYASDPTYYASQWKANALGVDLNMNFDAEWDKAGKRPTDSKSPSYLGYKGTSAECAAESKALAEFIRENKFDFVLSYHMMGSVIYWDYGDNKDVIEQSREIALRIAAGSGYPLGDPGSSSVAGLKDYVMSKLATPSLTIEFGTEAAPAAIRDFDNIWARTKNVLAISADWILG